jgi:hypothetical protein
MVVALIGVVNAMKMIPAEVFAECLEKAREVEEARSQ